MEMARELEDVREKLASQLTGYSLGIVRAFGIPEKSVSLIPQASLSPLLLLLLGLHFCRLSHGRLIVDSVLPREDLMEVNISK